MNTDTGSAIAQAILDGFDLGVGFWHLFVRRDEERRTLLAAQTNEGELMQAHLRLERT